MPNAIIAHADLDELNRLERILSQNGYYVLSVTKDGNECVALAKKFHPDIIVCDFQLKHLSEAKLLEALPQDCKIIVVSATTNLKDISEALSRIRTVLCAPYTEDALIKAIEET